MIRALLISILFCVSVHSAWAEQIDCEKNPTYLRKIPGGHELVYYDVCLRALAARTSSGSGHALENPTIGQAGPGKRGSTNGCRGLCYGETSTRTGLPRDQFVRGYYRNNGTYVRPYTRSRR